MTRPDKPSDGAVVCIEGPRMGAAMLLGLALSLGVDVPKPAEKVKRPDEDADERIAAAEAKRARKAALRLTRTAEREKS